MNKWINDSEVRQVLTDGLEEIARFARFGFRQRGRGTVAIFPDDESISRGVFRYTLEYLSYRNVSFRQGAATRRIIAGYDPLSELVVQYNRSCGKIRTIHLKVPSIRSKLKALSSKLRVCRQVSAFQTSISKFALFDQADEVGNVDFFRADVRTGF